jgi:hypothetical protein
VPDDEPVGADEPPSEPGAVADDDEVVRWTVAEDRIEHQRAAEQGADTVDG